MKQEQDQERMATNGVGAMKMTEPNPNPYLVGVTEDFPGGNDDELVQWAFEAGAQWAAWLAQKVTRTMQAKALEDAAMALEATTAAAFGRNIRHWRGQDYEDGLEAATNDAVSALRSRARKYT